VTSTIRKDNYVRIIGGLYDGDLGKVYDVRKRHFDVALVPRINTQDMIARFRDLK
jgi:ribosomal protein L24